LDGTVKTYIEELLTTFSGFHQTIFSFLTAHSLQQLFSQLTAHNNFFHSHSPTKQTHTCFIISRARSPSVSPSLPLARGHDWATASAAFR
jgi:hypothetical protein